MFVLILVMVLQLQETGTEVKVVTERIENIESKRLCDEGARAWVEAMKNSAIEPRTDYEPPDGEPAYRQPIDDQFKLLTPAAVCVQQR